jgi:ubiquinone/menaquinone biosynthesis C-methylase UbiE
MGGTELDLATVRGIWERDAPRYDGWMRVFDRLMIPGGREWLCAQASGRVLEVAVGTGLNLPHYPADVQLTGLDLSRGMLALARRRAAITPLHIGWVHGSAQALPFTDGSFDTVLCCLGLCCIPDDRAAITEMHRVLRPGGTLLLLDHVISSIWLVTIAQRLLEKLLWRACGDHQTRRPLHLVLDAGFTVTAQQRSRAGIIERVAATKPAKLR